MKSPAKISLLLGMAVAVLALPSTAAAQRRIRCESNNGRRQYCGRYAPRQVRFRRQVSQTPCVWQETWGVDRDGLWVDRGCRAEFVIYGDGDRDNRGGPGARGGASAGQRIRCSSDDGRRQYCGRYARNEIQFDRQISDSPCVQGRTWGVDREGLWVDRGCRAEFIVRRGRYPGSGENWRGGQAQNSGACFYKDYNFSGDHFCMQRGESRKSLDEEFDGKISSIRVFGGAVVTVFNDGNFRNGEGTIDHDIRDLRQWHMSSRPSHTWNDRISSIRVY
jgi:hypothetical protein